MDPEDSRKLVTVRRILRLDPIPGADKIVKATIDGWTVVSKIEEFQVGDLCLFFEIDSFLPAADPRFGFLMKDKITYKGVEGVRIRTMKLRGQLSQGLAQPLALFPEISPPMPDTDYAAVLKVLKYEAPIAPGFSLTGSSKTRTYPSCIPRTDQERIQNIYRKVEEVADRMTYEVSMKLDGTSMTVYSMAGGGKVGVCSRNLDLDITEEESFYIKGAKKTGLLAALPALYPDRSLAVQGELMGPSIQGNRERIPEHTFFVFNIYWVEESRFLLPNERHAMFEELLAECTKQGGTHLKHVPVLHKGVMLKDILPEVSLAALLAFAEGKSLHHDIREGLVFKSMVDHRSFKVISNTFLLKEK
eukprot:PhF_6_TR15091/c0_g1_i1/m.23741